MFVCWFGFLLVFWNQGTLGVDGSMVKALITPCLLLIWWENSSGEENKELSRQRERENQLVVKAGAATALNFQGA